MTWPGCSKVSSFWQTSPLGNQFFCTFIWSLKSPSGETNKTNFLSFCGFKQMKMEAKEWQNHIQIFFYIWLFSWPFPRNVVKKAKLNISWWWSDRYSDDIVIKVQSYLFYTSLIVIYCSPGWVIIINYVLTVTQRENLIISSVHSSCTIRKLSAVGQQFVVFWTNFIYGGKRNGKLFSDITIYIFR